MIKLISRLITSILVISALSSCGLEPSGPHVLKVIEYDTFDKLIDAEEWFNSHHAQEETTAFEFQYNDFLTTYHITGTTFNLPGESEITDENFTLKFRTLSLSIEKEDKKIGITFEEMQEFDLSTLSLATKSGSINYEGIRNYYFAIEDVDGKPYVSLSTQVDDLELVKDVAQGIISNIK